jgi:hypothetical protein
LAWYSGVVFASTGGCESHRCLICCSVDVALTQILFSNSKFIGEKMGDKNDNNNAAIGIAVLAFCVMDVSINALQV